MFTRSCFWRDPSVPPLYNAVCICICLCVCIYNTHRMRMLIQLCIYLSIVRSTYPYPSLYAFRAGMLELIPGGCLEGDGQDMCSEGRSRVLGRDSSVDL